MTFSPPWSDAEEWLNVGHFFSASIRQNTQKMSRVIQLAEEVRTELLNLEKAFTELCSTTCPSCTDNCCQRATVWYDFKDLLVYYIHFGTIPDTQIYKTTDGCCNLTQQGCRLERDKRPFLCTWYICAAQKGILSNGRRDIIKLQSQLDQIKAHRLSLEQEFIRVVTSS